MADLIKFRKGNKANLPNLRLGEPGVALDEERLYIGGINGNIQIPNMNDVKESSKIHVSTSEPPQSDDNTLWYEDLGEAPIVNIGDGLYVANAETGDKEPEDKNLWFDTKGE